jgi:phospholipid transport system substrate-binding protein
MMIRRKLVLAGIAGAIIACASPVWAAEDAALSQAADFVRDAGNRLAALLADQKDPEERNKQLQAFIDEVADVDGVARFSIGRFWRLATPAQQQEYLTLFHRVLFKNITTRISDYTSGPRAKVIVARPSQTDSGIAVPTTVEREGAPPVRVTWTVGAETGKLRIVDISAEGMSLRLTLRSDFSSFITRNNGDIGALLTALRQQAG